MKEQQNGSLHIGVAVLGIGVMALALAVGLRLIGLIGKLDSYLENLFSQKGLPAPSISLGHIELWGGTALLAFLLPTVILNIPGLWRRLVIWGFTFALTLAWAPVLLLAAHKPAIGLALVAVLWSGFCSIIYTKSHVLPVDKTPSKNHGES